jgi:hypothetical protein
MKAKLLGLIIALLGLSPASASTYTYEVNFDIGTLSITGTIVTACDNCVLDPNGYLVSWSFKASDGTSISSSDFGFIIYGSPIYPLTAKPDAIFFNPGPPPGLLQFTYDGGYLGFQSADDVPSSIYWSGERYYVVYGLSSDFQIAEISTTPLPAALPLFASGLGALGLLGWRRRRKKHRCDGRIP